MIAELKHLVRLQSIDREIAEVRSRIDAFPAASKALEQLLESALAGVETSREKIKTNQLTRKKLEGDVATHSAKVVKYREQMNSVKTNEEYRALQKEIDFTEQAIRKLEDSILDLEGEFDGLQSGLKSAETVLKQDQQRVQSERGILEGENGKNTSSLDSYMDERRQVLSHLSEELIVRYERVRKARNGTAVAEARDYKCEGCQVRIRPQVFQDVKKNDRLIECDGCSRILYFAGNMDHPYEVA